MSNSLWPRGLQHNRLPCPSPSPGICSNSHPLSQWYYLITISSSAALSFCLQSFPASGSFPVSWLFASGSQSIRALPWASVFPMKIQGWFPLGLTGWISLQSKGLSRVFSSIAVWRHQFVDVQPFLLSNFHILTRLLERLALTIWTFVDKAMSLLFKMLSSFVNALFLLIEADSQQDIFISFK